MDSTNAPLEHLELTLREVFLPLLGTNQPSVTGAGINGDKLMDILHRLMAAVEVTQGHVEVMGTKEFLLLYLQQISFVFIQINHRM